MISPCVSICKLENDVCIGCNRTVKEITNWSRMTDKEREIVMQRIR